MQRATIFCTVGAAAAVLVGNAVGAAQGTQKPPVPNELPRSWSLEEIAKEAPPYGTQGRVYVLAWQVIEDKRPLRVESCLILKVVKEDAGSSRWMLSHLYRHPMEKKPKWQLSMMHLSGEPGTPYFPGMWIMHGKGFKIKPTNKDIYASLLMEEVGWRFELEKGWSYVSCGVCEKSWQEAIGEKPTRFFGK